MKKFNKFSDNTGIHRALVHQIFIPNWSSLLNYYRGEKTPDIPDPDLPDYPGEPMPDARYEEMLSIAQSFYGNAYLWGGKTPPNFDCSGFVGYCYKQAGIMPNSVVAYTYSIYTYCDKVAAGDWRPGDLAYWAARDGNLEGSGAHIGIYIGNNYVLDCAGSGVKYRSLAGYLPSTFAGLIRCPEI